MADRQYTFGRELQPDFATDFGLAQRRKQDIPENVDKLRFVRPDHVSSAVFLPSKLRLALRALGLKLDHDRAQFVVEREISGLRLAEIRKLDHHLQQFVHPLDVAADDFLEARAKVFVLVAIAEQLRESLDRDHRALEFMRELMNQPVSL